MEEILQKTLEAHRLMRHDFMNHLQVISGYLQLGQPDKVREYIKKVSGALERFKYLGRIEAPYLQSLLVYCLSTFGEDCCFNLEVTEKITLTEEDDRGLTLLVWGVICPVYESILKNELECGINIKKPSVIEIGFAGQNCINERHNMMKLFDGLGKSYPRYSLAVTEEDENKGFRLLIAGKE